MSGERFRKARENVDLSQGQVAIYADTGQGYLSNIELGKRWPSTWTLLCKLAKRYNVSTDYLLGLSDDPSPPTRNHFGEALPPEGEVMQLVRLAQRMSDELLYALLTVAEALASVEDNPTPASIAQEMRAKERKQRGADEGAAG